MCLQEYMQAYGPVPGYWPTPPPFAGVQMVPGYYQPDPSALSHQQQVRAAPHQGFSSRWSPLPNLLMQMT
jgi:hypothetical protein